MAIIKGVPFFEPVTLEEMKNHSRIDVGDDDLILTGLMKAAREYCETFTGRSLCSRVIVYILNDWPSGGIYLPCPPVTEVLEVLYRPKDAAAFTNFNDFEEDDTGMFKRVVPTDRWPSGELHPVNAIQVEYMAGYDTMANVPESIKSALRLVVGAWYENREGVLPAGHIGRTLPMGVESLLWQERVFWTEDLNK